MVPILIFLIQTWRETIKRIFVVQKYQANENKMKRLNKNSAKVPILKNGTICQFLERREVKKVQ